MGDAVMLFWVGYFLGFWTCALAVVWFRILRPWRARRLQQRHGEIKERAWLP